MENEKGWPREAGERAFRAEDGGMRHLGFILRAIGSHERLLSKGVLWSTSQIFTEYLSCSRHWSRH